MDKNCQSVAQRKGIVSTMFLLSWKDLRWWQKPACAVERNQSHRRSWRKSLHYLDVGIVGGGICHYMMCIVTSGQNVKSRLVFSRWGKRCQDHKPSLPPGCRDACQWWSNDPADHTISAVHAVSSDEVPENEITIVDGWCRCARCHVQQKHTGRQSLEQLTVSAQHLNLLQEQSKDSPSKNRLCDVVRSQRKVQRRRE